MKRFVWTIFFAFLPALAFAQDKSACCLTLPVEAKAKPAKGKGYKPLTPEKRAFYRKISNDKHNGRLLMMAQNQTLPPAFDARTTIPLPVWDQSQCGSCYLDSTVRTATCTLIKGGYGKADNSFMLSVQYGMDRPRDFGGCNGGNGTEVIDWMVKNGWVAETYVDSTGVHNDYPPYTASVGNDRTKPGAKVWMKGADWGFVNANGTPTTDEIKAANFNYGRLNISLDAGGQFSNEVATITSLGTNIDHEINLVAYDDNHDNGNGTKGAFLLENQWSKDWANGGYIWCSYTAARNLVDVFFVTASPLPPPPTPPTPPGPTPPGPITATITVKIDGQPDQVFPLVLPAGGIPAGMELVAAGTTEGLQKMKAIFDGLPKTPPKAEPKKSSRVWTEDELRIIRETNAAMRSDVRPYFQAVPLSRAEVQYASKP